jgi:hypothetical protein
MIQVNSTDLGWMLNVSKSVSDVDGKPLTAVGPMIAKIFSSFAVNLGLWILPECSFWHHLPKSFWWPSF